eukprot:c33108_g1_i1 orf=3-170(-)
MRERGMENFAILSSYNNKMVRNLEMTHISDLVDQIKAFNLCLHALVSNHLILVTKI